VSATTPEPVVQLRDVGKSFGPVTVLSHVDLDLVPGEVLGLVGENGAGKTTIVNILSGIHRPSSGSVVVDGEPVTFGSPTASARAGIAVIHQEPALFPELSVAENVFMGRQPGRAGTVDWRAMRRRSIELLAELDVHLDVDLPVAALTAAHRQLVEIAKALSMNARVLILDEPTASLSGREVDDLLGIMRVLRDRGVALVLITHRLDEIFAVCDRLTVLRDGAMVAQGLVGDFDRQALISKMVGRRLDALYPKVEATVGDVVLAVTGLSSPGHFEDVSFEVRAGEIVGLAGLVGAGRTEVARCIFGLDAYASGSVTIDGEPLAAGDPSRAVDRGIGLVPEDRRHQGLVLELPIDRNIGLTLLRQLTSWGLISGGRERRTAEDYARRLQIRATGVQQLVGTLSGGNQQKVVLGKWLARNPRLLILDEPTRGIDVGTKAEVYRLISTLAAEGLAILLISSELPEVLGMSDRVLVMAEGRLRGEFDRATATPEAVMAAATTEGVDHG
jgi:rhamnose transport system ATP-binding protein